MVANHHVAGSNPVTYTKPAGGLANFQPDPLVNLSESGLLWDNCLVYFRGLPGMTELEVLSRDIIGLKELLRVAWKDLANPLLTPFERREARNQIDQYSIDLRRYLKLIEVERSRLRRKSQEESGGLSFDKPKLRLLRDGL
jgi:hypothetical protein